jgi:hypothetical protein
VARPCSRVRPLETPGNRRPREMIVAPLHRGGQNPAYRPSPTRVSLRAHHFRDACLRFHAGETEGLLMFPRRFEQLHDPPTARGAEVRVDLRGRPPTRGPADRECPGCRRHARGARSRSCAGTCADACGPRAGGPHGAPPVSWPMRRTPLSSGTALRCSSTRSSRTSSLLIGLTIPPSILRRADV